jgi:hypothetical protein
LRAIGLLKESISIHHQSIASIFYPALAQVYLHTGQYENVVKAMEKTTRKFAYPWTPLIWFALKERRYSDALTDSQHSLLELQYDPEWYTWVQVQFGLALYGLGRSDKAKSEFYQALQYCVEARAFLPLMHLIPFIPVVLADCGDPFLQERAVELYAMAKTLPFVANSKLFEDIAEKPLQEATAHLPTDVIQASKARGQELDWWERADVLLDELKELGWDSADG